MTSLQILKNLNGSEVTPGAHEEVENTQSANIWTLFFFFFFFLFLRQDKTFIKFSADLCLLDVKPIEQHLLGGGGGGGVQPEEILTQLLRVFVNFLEEIQTTPQIFHLQFHRFHVK